jgi:hypothetical protein
MAVATTTDVVLDRVEDQQCLGVRACANAEV